MHDIQNGDQNRFINDIADIETNFIDVEYDEDEYDDKYNTTLVE